MDSQMLDGSAHFAHVWCTRSQRNHVWTQPVTSSDSVSISQRRIILAAGLYICNWFSSIHLSITHDYLRYLDYSTPNTLFLRDRLLCSCNPFSIIIVDNKEALRRAAFKREKRLQSILLDNTCNLQPQHQPGMTHSYCFVV